MYKTIVICDISHNTDEKQTKQKTCIKKISKSTQYIQKRHGGGGGGERERRGVGRGAKRERERKREDGDLHMNENLLGSLS